MIALLLAAATPTMAGDWVTEDRSALVRIGPCGQGWCGRIVRVLNPAAPRNDGRNPDRALRSRPLVGLPVLSGFGPGGAGTGRAYDPKSGRSYRAYLRLDPEGTLRVTGCLAVICRSQHWTRPH